MRYMTPNRLSWTVLIDTNTPTVSIDVARTPGSRNAMYLLVWKICCTRAGEAPLKLLPKNASHMNGWTNVMTRTQGLRNVRRTSRAYKPKNWRRWLTLRRADSVGGADTRLAFVSVLTAAPSSSWRRICGSRAHRPPLGRFAY